MDLASLQRAFQQHVLNGDDAIAQRVASSAAVPASQRLKVYEDAYRLRLVDALAHNYPRLRELLGDEQFNELAQEYLQAHPSSNPSVRWLGDRLPDFLRERETTPVLSDLARWEWVIAAAFDAPDAAPVDANELAGVAADAWPALKFEFHPSMQLLEMHSNAAAIFKALTETEAVPEPQAQETQTWLIWRQEFTPRYRSLQSDEATALTTAKNHGSFEDICTSLAASHDEDQVPLRAITLLKTWLGEQLVTGVLVPTLSE
jgi:hypothetical protein